MHHKRNGFTLAECLISVAVITVLVAVMIPIFQKQLEKSRESADLSNVRSAYAEVMTEVLSADTSNNIVRTVKLKQKQNGWQSLDPVSIAGITHYKNEGDTDNWKGVPTENGECEVSYNENTGIVFDWKGKSSNEDQDDNENDTDIVIKFNNDLHNVLTNTGLLANLISQGVTRFEIDSKCPNSDMVKKVNAEIGKETNSLLAHGTWAYLGSPRDDSGRYLFWTSVDTNKVGAGKKIPVLISRADGGFYISEITTAERNNKGQIYIAIADHIYNANGFRPYTNGEKYDTLDQAYSAYVKLTDEKYQDYKETLPKNG